MTFGPLSKTRGVPWNGSPAPVQRYRYFPAVLKNGIAFLSSRVTYVMDGGWRRRGKALSREARRRALIALLRVNHKAVEGVRPPADVCDKSAHRARMERRLTERQAEAIRKWHSKPRSYASQW